MVGKRRNRTAAQSATRIKDPLGSSPAAQGRSTSDVKTLSRITAGAVIVAVAAILFSLITVGGNQNELGAMRATSAPAVIAKAEIPKNTVITPELVEVVTMPSTYIEKGCSTTTQDVIGKTALYPIPEKGQVSSGLLTGSDNTSYLAAALENGFFATSIAVDAETGLAGLLTQGDRVDVLSGGALLMENVSVLALDTHLTEAISEYSTVTLQVSRADAEALQTAQISGDIRLVLHSAAGEEHE
ncbi:MAG: Flp pilus assembly protein CpaB [Raoultibacter sp.]